MVEAAVGLEDGEVVGVEAHRADRGEPAPGADGARAGGAEDVAGPVDLAELDVEEDVVDDLVQRGLAEAAGARGEVGERIGEVADDDVPPALDGALEGEALPRGRAGEVAERDVEVGGRDGLGEDLEARHVGDDGG